MVQVRFYNFFGFSLSVLGEQLREQATNTALAREIGAAEELPHLPVIAAEEK